MAASIAEAYMLILRPIPVLGEAWAIPFNGQIPIDKWQWKLTPEAEQRAAAAAEAETGETGPQDREGDPEVPTRPELPRPRFDGDALIDSVQRMQTSRYAQPVRDKKVRELIERAVAEHEGRQAAGQQAAGTGAGEDNKGELTFSFSKGVDLATSQMLYSLANNDLIPTIILTLFHRSSTSPVTLVITLINVRLKSCTIRCEESETISEMNEDWTAQYEHISYVYQNRPPAGITASPFALATQGRVKTFIMVPRGGGSGPL